MEKENKFDLSMLSAQFSAIEVKNLYTFKLWTAAEMLCQMQDAADPGFAAFCQVAGSWAESLQLPCSLEGAGCCWAAAVPSAVM